MSKPKYRWWCYVINVAGAFLQIQDGTDLDPEACREWEAVQRAARETGQLPHGSDRLAVMNMVYQSKGKRTLKEAAACVGAPEPVARLWHGDFLRLVGRELGFTVED